MSNSQDNRSISTLEIRLRYVLSRIISLEYLSKVVQNLSEQTDDPYEEFSEYEYKRPNSKHSREPERHTRVSFDTIPSDSQQSLISTCSGDEELTNSLIERMKMEEQCMEEELKSMKYGDECNQQRITLMKYHEKRMEYEIDLMKRREKPLDKIVFDQTPIYENTNFLINEINCMKKREKHMACENTRMYHYKERLEIKIRTIKLKIENIRTSSITTESYTGYLELHNPLHQSPIQPINYDIKPKELYNKLAKLEMKLKEHSNEIEKRATKLDDHRNKQIECENELQKLHDEIQQEKYMLKAAIRRRKDYGRELLEYRIKRINIEIELWVYSAQRIFRELQFVKGDEKVRQYEEEQQLSYTLHLQQCEMWKEQRKYQEEKLECRYKLEDHRERLKMLWTTEPISFSHTTYEISVVIEQPKYDIFISYADREDFTIDRIRNALPQSSSTHVLGDFSSTNIKICLDNTSSAVIAIINKTYELSTICEVDMIHIFKRQFPLVLVITDLNFKPTTDWLTIVWHAPNTQKVFLDYPDFEENLRSALTDAKWNLSPNLDASKPIQSTKDERSERFVGDHHEWTIAYNNPAQVCQNYRHLISDPLQIATDTKLQNIYYNYIRIYFENPEVMSLFGKGAMKNDIHAFIRAYTVTKSFTEALNRHLAANILFYFESTLYNHVDYQLIKCLIDFVALLIYREELSQYLFNGTVYRGMIISGDDLFKYIVGSRIMNTSFLSTTKEREVAEAFSRQNQQEFAVLCAYEIHNKNNRRTALKISDISNFPGEQEILILPFSPFYVKSVKRPTDNSNPIEIMLVEDDIDNDSY